MDVLCQDPEVDSTILHNSVMIVVNHPNCQCLSVVADQCMIVMGL